MIDCAVCAFAGLPDNACRDRETPGSPKPDHPPTMELRKPEAQSDFYFVESCEFHKEPSISFLPLGFRWRKLRVRFRRSQNYVVIHAVFAMNVGLRVLRRGDHFEKSLPRRVTDQHHKLPVLGVEVAIGRTLDVTCPEDRSSDPLRSGGIALLYRA